MRSPTIFFTSASEGGLWRTDGSPGGEIRIDLDSDPDDFFYPTFFQKKLLFCASPHGQFGVRWLWASQSKLESIKKLVIRGAANSFLRAPSPFFEYAKRLFFRGYSASGSLGLWTTDGTAAGTYEILCDGASAEGISPCYFAELSGKMLFFGLDILNRGQLWYSDGTSQGTRQIVVYGASPTGFDPNCCTKFGDKVYFSGRARDDRDRFWRTDGTSEGTEELVVPGNWPYGFGPCGFVELGERLYFNGPTPGYTGFSLWRTDGTTAGTELIKENVGPFGPPDRGAPVVLGDRIYFTSQYVKGKMSLWESDGTNAGTRLVTFLVRQLSLTGWLRSAFR